MGAKQKAKKSPRYVKKSTLNTSQDSFKSSELNESTDKFKEELIDEKTISEQQTIPEAENKKINESFSSKSSDDEDVKTLIIHSLPKNLTEEKVVSILKTHSLNPRVKISHLDGKTWVTLTFNSVPELEKAMAIVLEQDFDGIKVVKHADRLEFVEVIKERDEGEKSESSSLSSDDEEIKENKGSEVKEEHDLEIISSGEGISSQYDIIDIPTEHKEESKHHDDKQSENVIVKLDSENTTVKKIQEIHDSRVEETQDHNEEKIIGHIEKSKDENKLEESKHEEHLRHEEKHESDDHLELEDKEKHEDLDKAKDHQKHKQEDHPKEEIPIQEHLIPHKDHHTPEKPINTDPKHEVHKHPDHHEPNLISEHNNDPKSDSNEKSESNISKLQNPVLDHSKASVHNEEALKKEVQHEEVKHEVVKHEEIKLEEVKYEEVKYEEDWNQHTGQDRIPEETLTTAERMGISEEPDSSSIYKGSVAYSLEVHPDTINEKELDELVQMEVNLDRKHREDILVNDKVPFGCGEIEQKKEEQSSSKWVWVLVGLGVVGTLAFSFYKYKIKS